MSRNPVCGLMGCEHAQGHGHQEWQLWTREEGAEWEPFGEPSGSMNDLWALRGLVMLEGVDGLLEWTDAPYGFPPLMALIDRTPRDIGDAGLSS